MAADYTPTITRGENRPLQWRFKSKLEDGSTPLFDMSGSELVLTIKALSRTIRKSTVDDADTFVMDVETAIAKWTPTPEETRSLPVGNVARYGLERRIGDYQRVLVAGALSVKDAPNDD